MGGPLPSEHHMKPLLTSRSGAAACWGRAGGCPGWASGLSLPCLVGRKGMGKKNPPDPARPWGWRQPSGWAWPGPLGWWPLCGYKFSKSSVIETLLPVFEGSRLGHLRLASCACSAVATWGERNSGEGEEIQISLVPRLFPRIVMLITDQFHPLLKTKLL